MRLRHTYLLSVLLVAVSVGMSTPASARVPASSTSRGHLATSATQPMRLSPSLPPPPVEFPTVSAARHARLAASTSTTYPGAPVFAQNGYSYDQTIVAPPKVYLDFWGTQWGTESTSGTYATFSGDPDGLAPYLQAFFSGLGTNHDAWSSIISEYCSGVAKGATTCQASDPHVPYPSGDVLAGVWYDNSQAAPAAATAQQIDNEADLAGAHFAVPTPASDTSPIVYVISPTGTHPDGFNTPSGNFCAYHEATANTVFVNMPYVPDIGAQCGVNFVNPGPSGVLDGVSIVAGHEYAETLTDWLPYNGWMGATLAEIGDICSWLPPGNEPNSSINLSLSTGSFAVQPLWSNIYNACINSDPPAPVPPNTFSLTATPITIPAGYVGTTTVSYLQTSGLEESVSLSASGTIPGATTPSGTTTVIPLIPADGGPGTVTYSVDTTTATPPGTYSFTVTGVGQLASAPVTVTVPVTVLPANLFSVPPVTVTVVSGENATLSIPTSVTSGAPQTVALNVTGFASGTPLISFPTAHTSYGVSWGYLVTAGQTLTGTVFGSLGLTPIAPGTYTYTLTGAGYMGSYGTDGMLQTQPTVTVPLTVVVVPANTFSFSAPSAVGNVAGSSSTATLDSSVITGSSQPLTYSVSGLPLGISVTLPSAPVASGSPASLIFTTSEQTAPGFYHLIVTATGSSGTSQEPLELVVRPLVSTFGARLAQTALAVSAGRSTRVAVIPSITHGYPQTLKVSVTGAPRGVRVILPRYATSSQKFFVQFVSTKTTRHGNYRIRLVIRGSHGTRVLVERLVVH